ASSWRCGSRPPRICRSTCRSHVRAATPTRRGDPRRRDHAPAKWFDTAVSLLSPGDQPPDVTRFDVETAAQRIMPYVRSTPVLELAPGAFGLDGALTLKLELLQHTGSFKPRGAFNRMLTAEVDASGVLAASGGNFGLAVAYAARVLGHPAEIFVPATSPAMKIERIRSYGAT